MSRNSRIIAVLTGALTVAALGTLPGAGTAAAEPVFVPKAGDVVGVGSDTTQFALNYLADGHDGVAGYNTAGTSGRLVTFDALGEGLPAQITLREGTAPITRPNGSGAGKALLYGAGNNVAVNYARSSSALSQAEISANLQQLPFAVDGLRLAVRAAGSNAPATITPAQLVDIFDGTVTNWNQIGGVAGAIVPLVPQSGSGTRSFFLSQLKAANGGVDVTLAPSVVETQEHSDADIKSNLNAIAPFSTGRAKTAPTVKLLGGADKGGFEANRALYNVVRQGDLASSWATGDLRSCRLRLQRGGTASDRGRGVRPACHSGQRWRLWRGDPGCDHQLHHDAGRCVRDEDQAGRPGESPAGHPDRDRHGSLWQLCPRRHGEVHRTWHPQEDCWCQRRQGHRHAGSRQCR